MIDRSTIQRVIDAANIVDVISDFIPLRKSGTSYKGKCPFHDDTTPSFVVTPSKGIFKCFACGESGDVITFLMKHNGMSYPEAIKWLGNKYVIVIEENRSRVNRKEETLYNANAWAADYFAGNLSQESGKRGLEYLVGRGFTENTIKTFRLGYAMPNISSLSMTAFGHNITRKTLQDVGLAYKGTDTNYVYDRFTNRVIFPWINTAGRVVAFGGRKLDAETKGVEQKYINSCESPIFSKSNELYGIYQAKSAITLANHAYIVEGYTDVISLHQAGVKNVVACSGTALSANHAKLLKRFCKNVTLMFDGDEAGLKAATHNIEPLLAEGINVKVIVLTNDVDPDALAKIKTGDDLKAFLTSSAIDFLDFYTLYIINKETDIPSKSAAIADVCKIIDSIPEEITKSQYVAECRQRFSIADDNTHGTESLAARMDKMEAEIVELKQLIKSLMPS